MNLDPIHDALSLWDDLVEGTEDIASKSGVEQLGILGAEGIGGALGSALGVASDAGAPVKKAGADVLGALAGSGEDDFNILAKLLTGGKKAPPKKKAAAKTAANGGDTLTEVENQLQAANVWNSLGQSLASQQESLDVPVEQAVSGALTEPATKEAEQTALNSIGLSPNDSAAKWLNSNIQQANKNDSPLQAAMNAYGAAYAQGQTGVDAALAQSGKANQLAVATAPEADWVNALTQHVLSNVNYYGEGPTSALASLPPALQYYLGQSGTAGNTEGQTSLVDLKPAGEAQLAPPTANLPGVKLPSISTGAAGSTPGIIPSDVSNAIAG